MWDFPLFPDSASTVAGEVDAVFFALLIVSTFFSLLIAVLLVTFAVRYRHGSRASRAEPRISRAKIEAVMIGVPFVIAMVLFFLAARIFAFQQTPPDDTLDIWVIGKQWMWKTQHPSGQREINTLHVPVGQPVRLRMISQDVIHSFYIPAFRVKQDVLPGRYTTLWFEATKPGEYDLFCAEYCGMDHSVMIGKVVVMEPADYQKWLSGASAEPQVPGTPGVGEGAMAIGGKGPFFSLGCNACHVPGSSVRAPRLEGIYDRPVKLANGETVIADADYIRQSIREPNARIAAGYPEPSLMPAYPIDRVSEEQIIELIEYIRRLGDPRGASDVYDKAGKDEGKAKGDEKAKGKDDGD